MTDPIAAPARFFAADRALVAGLAAVILLAMGARGAGAVEVGFVAALEGSAEIRTAAGSSWDALALDDTVDIGDTLRTGRDSVVKLLLVDDTTLTLGDETELEIDEYVVDPGSTNAPSVLNVLSGKLRTRVGEAFGSKPRLEMHTPTAVIGVKGTEWDTWVYEGDGDVQTLACCVSGEITLQNIDPSVSGVVGVPIDQCTRVLPKRAPDAPEPRVNFLPPGLTPIPTPATPSTGQVAATPLEVDFAAPNVSAPGVGLVGAPTPEVPRVSSGDTAVIGLQNLPPAPAPPGGGVVPPPR